MPVPASNNDEFDAVVVRNTDVNEFKLKDKPFTVKSGLIAANGVVLVPVGIPMMFEIDPQFRHAETADGLKPEVGEKLVMTLAGVRLLPEK